MPFACEYRPSSFGDFKETINHLITYHHDRENKKMIKKMDDTLLRTLNFKIVPEMCHDQGRELSINDSTETTQVSKPNQVQKHSTRTNM